MIQLVKGRDKERSRISRRVDIVVRARREESQPWRHRSKSQGNGLFRGKGLSQGLEQERAKLTEDCNKVGSCGSW